MLLPVPLSLFFPHSNLKEQATPIPEAGAYIQPTLLPDSLSHGMLRVDSLWFPV